MKKNSKVTMSSNGTIRRKSGCNAREYYEHQKQAIKCLDVLDQCKEFRTLAVIPTGGGKTYVGATWLLKSAISKHKKTLWLAHSYFLLDQAAESFQKYAYGCFMPNTKSFNFRIVSGAATHDSPADILATDDLLIVGKDSIRGHLEELDRWMENESEIYLVIDEAHHATAPTYRGIIKYVCERVPHLKLLGLTATPFRTAENEKGLLGKIFTDCVRDGKAVKGDGGIAYEISLKDLINRGILSQPSFISYETGYKFESSVDLSDVDYICRTKKLPASVQKMLTENAVRNRLIVDTYTKGMEEGKNFGQTIVFATNQLHAKVLADLFNKAGVPAAYVISEDQDAKAENEKKLQRYREGHIQVLVNVMILTEGVDLPMTNTVFLARPTGSKILMTQMIGRALRGVAAGGTANANIVSFVDKWDERISWINPKSVVEKDIDNEFSHAQKDPMRKKATITDINLGSLASEINEMIGPDLIDTISIEEKTPIGAYVFIGMDADGNNQGYKILVYNGTENSYKNMMLCLPDIMSGAESEIKSYEELQDYAETVTQYFFRGKMIPPVDVKDIYQVLLYYFIHHRAPKFYPFGIEMRQDLIAEFSAGSVYKNTAARLFNVLKQVQEKKETVAGLCSVLKAVQEQKSHEYTGDYLSDDIQTVVDAVISFREWIEGQEKLSALVKFPCYNNIDDLDKRVWMTEDTIYLPNDKFEDAFYMKLRNIHSEQLKHLLHAAGYLEYNDDKGGFEFSIDLQQGGKIVLSVNMIVLDRNKIFQ